MLLDTFKLLGIWDSPQPPRSTRFFIVAIIGLTLCSYYPAMEGGYIWDDDNYVTHNETLKTVSGLKDIWLKPGAVPQYYPLVHSMFWVEYRIWGLNPFGFHFINLVIHIFAAILIGILLTHLKITGAWLAAFIFAVHPVNVESVAWITERKNVLSTFFYLLAILSFLRFYYRFQEFRENRISSCFFYTLSLLFYMCALFSKTVACTFPVVILVILWLRSNQVTLSTVVTLIPFFIVGTALGLATVYLEKFHVGASGSEWNILWQMRFIIAGRALWFYLGKTLYPETLIFIYPRWDPLVNNWYYFLFPASFILLIVLLFLKRDRLGRGPLAAFLIYGIVLFPALGFFDIYPMRYSFVADHFQYMAIVPIIALATSLALVNLRKASHNGSWLYSLIQIFSARVMPIRLFTSIAVLGTLSLLTWNRCYAFQNPEGLWLDTLAKNPKAWMAHNNLGLIYAEKGFTQKSIYHYEETIALKPDHTHAYNNLAMASEKLGNSTLAQDYFYKALQLEPNNISVLNNCGNYFAHQGELGNAEVLYNRALKLNASSSSTLINLANLNAQRKDFKKAIGYYLKVLSKYPNHSAAHFNLANVFKEQKRIKKAIVHYQLALKNKPNFIEAKNNLKMLRSLQFQNDENR